VGKKSAKTVDEHGRKKGKGKEPADWTSADLRFQAAELRQLVEMLEHAATTMDKMKIDRYETMVGNWHKALKILQKFVPSYVLARLAGEASDRGLEFKEFLEVKPHK
jgi:hypothetical protein